MRPIDFIAKLPTDELKDRFLKELFKHRDPLLTESPSEEELKQHLESLFEKFKHHIEEI